MPDDVIILSGVDWGFTWQSSQIVACYLAQRGCRVVYVNGTMIKNPRFRNFFRKIRRKYFAGIGSDMLSSARGLTVIKPVVLPSTNGAYRWINKKILLKRLLKKIDSLKLEDPVLIWQLPNLATLEIVNHVRSSRVVCRCLDNYVGLQGAPRDTEKIEEELLKKSDVVTASSDFLAMRLRKKRPDVVKILPGVDYDLFAQADTGLVREIRQICYFGGIREDRIDIDLLLGLTRKLHDRKFLFIGPVHSRLPRFPCNVTFAGEVPHDDLQGYLRQCDCILFPYRLNEFTQGIMPAKFFEAFATGKPVIATPLMNFMPFREVMSLAMTGDEFGQIIEHIQEFETAEKYERRRALARQHSWDVQCGKLAGLISGESPV